MAAKHEGAEQRPAVPVGASPNSRIRSVNQEPQVVNAFAQFLQCRIPGHLLLLILLRESGSDLSDY